MAGAVHVLNTGHVEHDNVETTIDGLMDLLVNEDITFANGN